MKKILVSSIAALFGLLAVASIGSPATATTPPYTTDESTTTTVVDESSTTEATTTEPTTTLATTTSEAGAAPPPGPQNPPPQANPPPGRPLPRAGAGFDQPILIALTALLAGGALILIGRQRRRVESP